MNDAAFQPAGGIGQSRSLRHTKWFNITINTDRFICIECMTADS